jgi:hypothetical protein
MASKPGIPLRRRTFLAVFATAHLTPRLRRARSTSSRARGPHPAAGLALRGGLMLAARNVVYLIGSIWLIVA